MEKTIDLVLHEGKILKSIGNLTDNNNEMGGLIGKVAQYSVRSDGSPSFFESISFPHYKSRRFLRWHLILGINVDLAMVQDRFQLLSSLSRVLKGNGGLCYLERFRTSYFKLSQE